MGTINYTTSDYITMGVKPYRTSDFKDDPDYMGFLREEWGIDTDSETDVYNAISDTIRDYYEDDALNIETELEKHRFYYFHIVIEPGYYEGFSLNIENNFPIAFDSWEEKRAAQKEITEIKAFLKECAGLGLAACYPGWCTSYEDYNGTLKAINAAIQEMREEVKETPTWRTYESEYRSSWDAA